MGITTAVFSKPAPFTVAALLVIGLSGCGSSTDSPGSASPSDASPTSSSPTSPPTSSSATSSATSSPSTAAKKAAKKAVAAAPVVTIKNFKYKVATSVAPGAEVVGMNNDAEAHTITSTQKGAFDVKVDPAAKATFKAPAKPGTYRFVCQFHADMLGKLVVK